ncbi:MAG: RusA family crossover junction endodeoxyribonuclease, partial [Methanomassiliicoccus sp.]
GMHVRFEGAEAEDYESGPMEYVGYQEDRYDHDLIEFFVAGEPVPQGSTKAFYIKKLERVVTTHTNANTDKWRQRIATEAQRANELRPTNFFSDDRRQGYEVTLDFVFTRPKSQPKKWKMNTKRPDLDKLVRAALDAITNILIPDDSQVVRITAGKCYGDADHVPGLQLSVRRME